MLRGTVLVLVAMAVAIRATVYFEVGFLCTFARFARPRDVMGGVTGRSALIRTPSKQDAGWSASGKVRMNLKSASASPHRTAPHRTACACAGGSMGKWAHTAGTWHTDAARDMGIQTTEDMKHHSVSARMPQVVSNTDKPLVVQFTGAIPPWHALPLCLPPPPFAHQPRFAHTPIAKHEKKEYSFCGGGYIKLLPAGLDQVNFGGDSPYSTCAPPCCPWNVCGP